MRTAHLRDVESNRHWDADFIRNALMKDYLQPAATFAAALAIGSLPFTVSMGEKGFQNVDIESRSRFPIDVRHPNHCTF